MTQDAHPIPSQSILIVEDQFMLSIDMKTAFEAKGWTVIGPSPNVEEALHYIETAKIDVACLDYRLGDETSESVAQALHEKAIPFIFLTGDNLKLQQSAFANSKLILNKPLHMDELVDAASDLLSQQGH